MEKRSFTVTVNVPKAAKQATLRADMRAALAQATGSEKVVVKPITVAKLVTATKKATAKKPASKTVAKKTTRAKKAA